MYEAYYSYDLKLNKFSLSYIKIFGFIKYFWMSKKIREGEEEIKP